MQQRLFFTLSLKILCILVAVSIPDAGADDRQLSWPTPNWDRDLALIAVDRIDTTAETDHLLRLASQRHPGTLELLTTMADSTDWPAPVRDAALFRFTAQLRSLPAYSVDTAVIDFLQNYQSATLVLHPESRQLAVPLYPVSSAAQGLVNQWIRNRSLADAASLIRQDPGQLIERYLDARDTNIRAGIESSLFTVGVTELQELLNHGLPLLSASSELTGLLGTAAALAGDSRGLAEVLIQGRGPALPAAIRLAGNRLSPEQLGELLINGIDAAPAATAALIIAEFAPQTAVQESIGDALLQTVRHPLLGSGAALALARWGTESQREQLMAMATDSSNLTAKRIETALNVYRDNVAGADLR
jgi:hypothetical protein